MFYLHRLLRAKEKKKIVDVQHQSLSIDHHQFRIKISRPTIRFLSPSHTPSSLQSLRTVRLWNPRKTRESIWVFELIAAELRPIAVLFSHHGETNQHYRNPDQAAQRGPGTQDLYSAATLVQRLRLTLIPGPRCHARNHIGTGVSWEIARRCVPLISLFFLFYSVKT